MRGFLILTFFVSAVSQAEIGSVRTAQDDESPRFRRASLGLKASGLVGRFGTDLQLKFTPEVVFQVGYGISTDFQSLFLGFRQDVMDWVVAPYFTVGYAQWFASGKRGAVGKTTPGFFGERFLSEKERNDGRFSESILFGGGGLEYMHHTGDFAGAAVYLEALLLADLDDLVTEPTFGLGARYYF